MAIVTSLGCSAEQDDTPPACEEDAASAQITCGAEIVTVRLTGESEHASHGGNGHIDSPGRGHEVGRGRGHDKHHADARANATIDLPRSGTFCARFETTGVRSIKTSIGDLSITTAFDDTSMDQGLVELAAGRHNIEVVVEADADWTIDLTISEANEGSDCRPLDDGNGDEIVPEPEAENGGGQPALVAFKDVEGGRTLTLVDPANTNIASDEVTVAVVDGFTDEVAANPLARHVTGIAYDLGPDGARFDPPLVATLSWGEGDLSDDDAREVRAYLRSEGSAEWIPTVTIERSVESRYIKVLVPHFTHLALGVPTAELHAPYSGDFAGEYGKANAERAYGSGFFENPFPDLSGQEGGNSMNFVSQAMLAGFIQSESPLVVYLMRHLFDVPVETPLLWIDINGGRVIDTAWSNAARMKEVADANGAAGLYLEYVTHDTLTEFMDYDLIEKGDIILADMPSDLSPDPDFVPDGVMDRAFIVSDIHWLRFGYNEIRVSSQDFAATNVGLGDINENYHYRALFTVYRPVDYAPVGTTQSAYSVQPERQACEMCGGLRDANGAEDLVASLADCQEMADSIVAMFPEFAAEEANVVLSTHTVGGYCYYAGDDAQGRKQVVCYKNWVTGGTLTNKTLFHEISHGMRGDRKLVAGDSGICPTRDTPCGSSEFQASIHEALYYPPERECTGGHYKFTDSAGNTRLPEETLAMLMQDPAIPISKLWDYVLGREDTLVDYLGRFGLPGASPKSSDLFRSQTYRLGTAERACDDGQDNNGNSETDCDDVFCATHPSCSP